MARGSRSGQVETYSWHSFTRSLIHFCWFGFSPPGFWLNKPCLCCKLADKTLKQFVHRSFILVGKMRQQTSATPAQRQSEKYLMISNALHYNNTRLTFFSQDHVVNCHQTQVKDWFSKLSWAELDANPKDLPLVLRMLAGPTPCHPCHLRSEFLDCWLGEILTAPISIQHYWALAGAWQSFHTQRPLIPLERSIFVLWLLTPLGVSMSILEKRCFAFSPASRLLLENWKEKRKA